MVNCLKVFLSCRNSNGRRRIPYWMNVSRGLVVDNCKVVYAFPSNCRLTPEAEVEFVKWCEYTEDPLVNNVKIVERCEESSREKVYVFPKRVYDELKNLYIEPMARGEEPFNTGVVLAGPPGVGKSVLARVISRMLGISTFLITPDSVLSKFVGESEKNIKEILTKAKRSEPSIVIINDAEWLLQSRRLASTSESSNITLHLQDIMFNEMQEISDTEKKVLFIASTNIKPSELDTAFVRYGRFGEPLFIPLPDYEALYEILRHEVGDAEAQELARKACNMGLSTADALEMVKRRKAGLQVDRKRIGGRGYSRIVVDQVEGFGKIFEYFPKEALLRGSRIYLHMNEDVGTSIVAQMAYELKKPVIKLVDIRFYDEAAHSANMAEAVMVCPTTLPSEIQVYLKSNVESSLFFVGDIPPQIQAFTFFSIHELKNILGSERLIKALLNYKGIKVSDSLMAKMREVATDASTLEALLDMISSLSYIDESLLSKLPYFKR